MGYLIMLLAAQVLYHQTFTRLMNEGMRTIWKKGDVTSVQQTIIFSHFRLFQFPTFWIFLSLVCKFSAPKKEV